MNYKKIHDHIIDRAKNRSFDTPVYLEQHHIIPKCEGGVEEGETVFLTHKEHTIVHLLRWKITNVIGNRLAYNLMKYGGSVILENRTIFSSYAAKIQHKNWKEHNPDSYRERQSNAGKKAGIKARDNKLGFHSLTKERKQEIGYAVGNKLASEKIGMFSDEYKKFHKTFLYKKIHTPDKVFNSMTDAALFYNVVPATITHRVKSKSEKFKEWFYIEEKKK